MVFLSGSGNLGYLGHRFLSTLRSMMKKVVRCYILLSIILVKTVYDQFGSKIQEVVHHFESDETTVKFFEPKTEQMLMIKNWTSHGRLKPKNLIAFQENWNTDLSNLINFTTQIQIKLYLLLMTFP